MKINRKVLLLVSLLGFAILSADANYADRIIASVNDSIILQSEYDKKIELLEKSSTLSVEVRDSIRENMLSLLIDGKMMQVIADKDSILIDTVLLEKDVDRRIEELKKNFSDEKDFTAYIEANGITLEQLKDNYLEQALTMALKQQVVMKNNLSVSVTENEIKDFYEMNADSFKVPLSADLYHISVVIQPDSGLMISALQKIESLMMYIKTGVDFTSVAKDYSEDPSSKKGGYVGFIKYNDLPAELAGFLYSNMKADTIVFTQSRKGYHIIKIIKADADSIKFQHIVVKLAPSKDDSLKAFAKAKEILLKIRSNEITFEDGAKKYTDDFSTKESGGYVGKIALEMLSENVREQIKVLENDKSSDVLKGDFGYELFMIKNKTGGFVSSYDEVRQMISSVIENRRVEEEIAKLIEKEKKKVFVRIM